MAPTASPRIIRVSTHKVAAPLSAVEFKSVEDVVHYANLLREMCLSMALEVESTAGLLEREFCDASGGFIERYAQRRMARKATAPLRDAAQGMQAAGTLAGRFWLTFMHTYGDVLEVARKRTSGFSFTAGGK